MAVEPRQEIVDRESLDAWIEAEERPLEWLQALSCRMLLRILPIALVVPIGKTDKNASNIWNELTVDFFRAVVISRAGNIWPTRVPKVLANEASDAVYIEDPYAADVYLAASYAVGEIGSGGLSYAEDAIDVIAMATDAVVFSDALTSDNDNINIWDQLNEDCRWLSSTSPTLSTFSKISLNQSIQVELMKLPLWHTDTIIEAESGMPAELLYRLQEFTSCELARTTSFSLIPDWYRGILPMSGGAPESPFGEKMDLALAQQNKEFWEGEPLEVMDRVAEFVGWERGGARSSTAEGNGKKIEVEAQQISANRVSVRLQLGGIKTTIAGELDLLGDKPNDKIRLTQWESKREFLDKMDAEIGAVINLLPLMANGNPLKGDKQTANQLGKLAAEFENWLSTNRPEMVNWVARLGSASMFIGLMAALGASMPVATPVVLAMTCGKSAMEVMLGKKKPK